MEYKRRRRSVAHHTVGNFLIILAAMTVFAAVSHADDGNRIPKPGAREKCPVCGMFVAKYPDWIASMLFRDGSRVYFDGAKDLFKYYFDMKRYDPSKTPSGVAGMYVLDYYSLASINAEQAYYVIGSDVFGPMGKELIPLEKESDAKEFLKDHKGKAILKFKQVTKQVVTALDQ